MAKLDEITIDITQEVIHDQIRKLAEAVYDMSGIKIDFISIDWADYLGMPSYIGNIDVKTSKRG